MIWDYRCPRCGVTQERQVPVDLRDAQHCSCGASLQRVQAFGQQHTIIPPYMRSGHDETTYIPGEPAAREKFLADAYRQHGRWRTDLEAGSRSDVMAKAVEVVPEAPKRPRKTTRQSVEQALRETKARFAGRATA